MRKRKIRKIIVPKRQPANLPKKTIKKKTFVRPLNQSHNRVKGSELATCNILNSSVIIPTKKSHRVFIVGGGPSINSIQLDNLKNEDTICVNAAVNFVPNPTYFITMDYSYFDPKRKINTVFKKMIVP